VTRHLAVLLVALAATTAAALGPRYGDSLTVGVLALPSSDQALPTSDGGRLVARLAGETLVDVAAEGTVLPRLVRSFSISAAGREWTLELRDGATFHDGQPVTAAAAVRSLRRFLRGGGVAAEHFARSLEGGSAFRSRKSEPLPAVAAADETRVVLRFAVAPALALAPLASPAAVVTSTGGKGAGPFVPTVSVPGKRAAFTAFTGHFGGRPYLDQVEVLALGRREALRAARDTGRVDAALVEGASRAHAVLLLRFDPARPAFRTKESRAIVASTIDRRTLVARYVPGGEPLSSLLAPGMLAASGSPPSAPRRSFSDAVTLAVGEDVPLGISQRVVAHLLDLGLAVTTIAESAPDAGPVESDLRLFLFVPEVAEPGLTLEELAARAPGVPVVAETLAEAAHEATPEKRRALLLRAEQALRAEAVLVALAAYPFLPATAPGVHGVQVTPNGRLVLEDAWREP
jgi:MarR-like DNA-binding transcriptional regulator SgrR of sgrS sRNA